MASVRTQVIVLHGLLILCILLLAFFLLQMSDQVRLRWKALEQQTTPVVLEIYTLRASGETLFGATNRLMLLKHVLSKRIRNEIERQEHMGRVDHETEELQEAHQYFIDALGRYAALVHRFFPDEQSLLEEVQKQGVKLVSISQALLMLSIDERESKKILALDDRFEVVRHQFVHAIDQVMEHEQHELTERDASLSRYIDSMSLQMLLVVSGLILVFLMATWILIQRIVIPVKQLSEAAKEVAKGSFEVVLPRGYYGELGQLSDAFSYMVDMRRQAEQELIAAKKQADHASEAKSNFLAAMSHEIRTPMNVVVGMGDLLQESGINAEQLRYVKMMQRSGGALLELIDTILDLSRIEAGEMALNHVPFNPVELFNETLDYLSVASSEKGLEINRDFAPDIPQWCVGDGPRIRQVLVNLVGNAIKFTAHGSITVVLRQSEEQKLLLTVEDTGPGIEQDRQEAVFQRFTQEDGSIARRHGGSGLGLAICRELLEAMEGSITLKSIPGEGSCFNCIIPAPTVLAPVQDHIEVSDTEGTPKQGRILLVDDSEDNRLLVENYLKRTDYPLEMVVNGQEAVDRVKEKAPDYYSLILMDLQMPVLDGYSATRAIRRWQSQAQYPAIPILALSAHALVGDEQLSLEAGCNAHLTKPIKKQKLLEMIERYLEMSVSSAKEGSSVP
ncbi:ATP-binding protein [Magnetococcus sp. PR-3]|uniref:ATP-binding protein n=1 Tax=Magnetococcus sp. PR-3 TaxID=3120355 RepID=UPI002FCDEB01